jgi:glycosyltransferase involved in cell wall biosynthesis
LLDLGYLKKFYTSSYITSPLLQRIIKQFNLAFWSRRFHDGLGGEYVSANWKYEIKEIVTRKIKGNTREVNDLVLKRDVSFDQYVSNTLKHTDFDCFWGFQGSCLESLKVANKRLAHTICEMTIAHIPYAQKLLAEEAALHPEWADSIDFSSFPASYEKRLVEEPYEAKSVIAISEFLRNTLIDGGVEPHKISVIPLGFDVSAIKYIPTTVSPRNRPLRLLYAGRITQRKGVKYMLEAIAQFHKNDVELYIIGNIYGSGDAFNKYRHLYNYRPGVSQATLFELYADYDALIFPSVLEGFGLVTIEAMGAGLPVITTPNTNATELIQNGINGFVVPIRDTEAIVQAITSMRNMSEEQFSAMRASARETALRYTWDVHRNSIEDLLSNIN